MANIFYVSDTHFGHAATIFKFLVDGKPMRPFQSVEEMDNYMVEQWNKTVRPQDKVYHLGDVAMKRKDIVTVGRCVGHKRLVRGNHDIYDDKYYRPFFDAIYGTRVIDSMILSHIPIHVESLREGWANVHGHTHNNVHPLFFGPRYINISVEVTDYRPLSHEELKARIKAQKDENQRLVEENFKRLGFTKHRWSDEEKAEIAAR